MCAASLPLCGSWKSRRRPFSPPVSPSPKGPHPRPRSRGAGGRAPYQRRWCSLAPIRIRWRLARHGSLPRAYPLWYSLAMSRPPLTIERMVERAVEQHGFLRIADARDIGVGAPYLRKLAAKGRLQHRGWGLYRLMAIPPTPRDEYQEAVLWAGEGAIIGGEAAIGLWELADVNPRAIDVVLPPGGRVRKRMGPRVRIMRDRLTPADIDSVDNIPVVIPRAAIAQGIARGLDGTLIEQAIVNAKGRQFLSPLAEARLRVQLAEREQPTVP